MAENVDVPKLGKVPKPVLIAVAVGLLGFVGWRYYMARNGTGTDTGVSENVSDFDAEGTVPPVLGAVSPDNRYGSGDTGNTNDSGELGPGRFTNNGQWTDYVVGKLTQSDKWTYSDIVTAIGNGLNARPTNDMQQDILRAALAVGGQPPQGQITIVSGGNTAPAVAPGNFRKVSATADSITLAWDSVPGADSYRVTQISGGLSKNVTGTTVVMTGLLNATNYTFTVEALNGTGSTAGPAARNTFATTARTLTAPPKPSVSNITRTSATFKTTKPAGAENLVWYLNGVTWGTTESSTFTTSRLAPGKRYTVTVKGDVARQGMGPASSGTVFTTKKK